MKSVTYKKTDKGIIEVNNSDFDNNEIDNLSILMAEYEVLNKKIRYGSRVVNFVKTKEYKQSLEDSLQNVIMELLESKEYENHNNVRGLLRKAFYNRSIDSLRHESTYEIFKLDFSEYCQNKNYGITKQFLDEMLLTIKEILTSEQYKIFKLYHIKGLTLKEIAKEFDTSFQVIDYQLKKIGNKIIGDGNKYDGLKIACLVDGRYTSHNTGKKRRQHKRKQLTQKQIIKLSGKPYHLSIDDYQKPLPIKRDKLDLSKLPHTDKQNIKEFKIDKSSYMVVASNNYIYNKQEVFVSNVYQESIVLPCNNPYRNNYRYKRACRIAARQYKYGTRDRKPLPPRHF